MARREVEAHGVSEREAEFRRALPGRPGHAVLGRGRGARLEKGEGGEEEQSRQRDGGGGWLAHAARHGGGEWGARRRGRMRSVAGCAAGSGRG